MIVLNIQQAINYIEEHIYEELKPSDIAKQVYMSSYYFQKLFSLLCSCTLGEYIRNRRLTLAKDEILYSDKKIIDIAVRYGYNTAEGFTRAFYRFYGVTPLAARKRKCKLESFAKISVQSLLEGELGKMKDLSKRGYSVQDNGAIYYTKDMDKTSKWFEDVLGWYAGIDARNEEGIATYGCVLPFPGELVHMQVADFNGFHMSYGEPAKRAVLFTNVIGIDKLYSYVKENGWQGITKVKEQPWGGKTCEVTTIDGSIITFCEQM
ncbi:helix-turn-helix domain-containing protein [Clostridium sp. 'deep sea']|uniref:helix-turn-helix domain-containing protein n=1 Tax=Clostridium sp. 'deep sea' TaxID=2779445 RepID=UPI00189660D6|nr:helix-turn-helix domain-containing protein [Clostridium sp. 'deep sea']QOR34226.1 helix-turn-helix domain-containing protein [Clostridium sp. 'deep sea']